MELPPHGVVVYDYHGRGAGFPPPYPYQGPVHVQGPPLSISVFPPEHHRMHSAPTYYHPPTYSYSYPPPLEYPPYAPPSVGQWTPPSPSALPHTSAPTTPTSDSVPATCLAVEYHSIIDCGGVDSATGLRRLSHFSSYFGKEVEWYTAITDPTQTPLYRVSTLAQKLGCATNKVGMYLARRKTGGGGIYQASGFLHKPSGRVGLKAGGYFLSVAACREFELHFTPGAQGVGETSDASVSDHSSVDMDGVQPHE